MQKLEEYITVGTKRMRCGYTTGTCAAAATRAAAELLVNGTDVSTVTVLTPSGIDVDVEIEERASGEGWAQCAVRKDAGDDPDVTDCALIFTRIEFCGEPGVHIDAGEGVGRVTREGLDQPVGAAAINSVPRKMIAEQVLAALGSTENRRGFTVTVSVQNGAELAEKTFNPRMGIVGGISIIGTSGIVRPMSEEALIASIELELRMLHAQGQDAVVIAPGNYGRDFTRDVLDVPAERIVQCSNYLGAALDAANMLGFSRVVVVGHIGKMAKVAAGVMNTHSRVADARMETLAAHAALAGAAQATVASIMEAATTDAALDILDEAGLLDSVMGTLAAAVGKHLVHRAGAGMQVAAIVFSNRFGMLASTDGAADLLACFGVDFE